MTIYQFGDKMVNHYFCRHCGVFPFHEATANSGHYRINLGCLKGVNPHSLVLREIDGRLF